jgi:pheromone shutdown protein TraB
MRKGEDGLGVENSVQADCRLLKNRRFSLSVHFYIILPATLLRVLLAFLFPTLGTIIGAWFGGYKIVSSLW